MEFTGRCRSGRDPEVAAVPGAADRAAAARRVAGVDTPDCSARDPGPADPASAEFNRVFTEMLPRLHRAAVSLTGSASAAGDIVHDAYLRIARAPERFLRHPQPYAYAFTTMANILRDQWRRERRRLVVPEQVEGERTRADPLGGGLGELQARWEVVRLLRFLTAKQARVVVLVDLGGYTVDEAAALLGVHRSTLAVTRRRALSRLRAVLERERECDRGDGRDRADASDRADRGGSGGAGDSGRGGSGAGGSGATRPPPRPDAPS